MTKTIAQQLNVKEFPFIIKDKMGNEIYWENSDAIWYKKEFNDRGNQIYYDDSRGFWYKYEYDAQGNQIYYENSDGRWFKAEHDDRGKEIYWENSEGRIIDKRPKQREVTMDEIAKLLNIDVKDLKIKK